MYGLRVLKWKLKQTWTLTDCVGGLYFFLLLSITSATAVCTFCKFSLRIGNILTAENPNAFSPCWSSPSKVTEQQRLIITWGCLSWFFSEDPDLPRPPFCPPNLCTLKLEWVLRVCVTCMLSIYVFYLYLSPQRCAVSPSVSVWW